MRDKVVSECASETECARRPGSAQLVAKVLVSKMAKEKVEVSTGGESEEFAREDTR